MRSKFHPRRCLYPYLLLVMCMCYLFVAQPYGEHFEKLGDAINSLDPEIKLAARFSMDESKIVANRSLDDDQEVDDLVSSHGFEFIDGDNDSRARVLDSDDDSSGELFTSANDSHISIPIDFDSFSFARTICALVTIRLMFGFHVLSHTGAESHRRCAEHDHVAIHGPTLFIPLRICIQT